MRTFTSSWFYAYLQIVSLHSTSPQCFSSYISSKSLNHPPTCKQGSLNLNGLQLCKVSLMLYHQTKLGHSDLGHCIIVYSEE
jgi:hypothetical protein